MVSWFPHHQKIILLPLFLIGFFSVAFFADAATVAVHPQATVSNTWKNVSSGVDAACIGKDKSTAWACVNDQPANASSGSAEANDGDFTVIRSQLSTTASDESVFSFGSGLVSAGNAITNLSVVSYGQQWDCASCADYQLYYRIGLGGIKTFGASHVPPSTSSYSQFTDDFAVSLTPAELDQLQIGARQTVGNGSSRIQVTQIYVTVTYSVPETVAPAAVFDLAASSPTATSMRLDWTAPGDDGCCTGTATSYDIRYSTAVITDANWASATQVSGEPAPQIAGTNQSMTVLGLNTNTLYYFAMKTSDEVLNTSVISNVPSALTLPPSAPTVTTSAASGITVTSATLNGSANPSGIATTGWFRYSATNPGSCNDSFGTRLPSAGGTALGSGSAAVAYSNSASGLTSGTTYYYCAIASNSGGMAFGSVVSFFVPLPAAPTFPTPLTANPASVVSGWQSTLSWASSGADSCSASAVPANGQWDDIPSPPALSGSQLITNITVTTAFTITCINAGGSTPSSATVTVTPPPNVSGYAWAGSGENDGTNSNPGIGWISFSSRNCDADGNGFSDGVGTCPSTSTAIPSYGVLVSSASPGVLSGYAWANPNDAVAGTNNIGWISFNAADVVGCLTVPCAPTLNRTTGAVIGWARALGYQDAQSGGWDGWIRLWRDSDGDGVVNTDTGVAASDYGVLVSNCNWSGYAWGGGTNIGWIHFGGGLYPTTGSGNACASVTPQCSDGVDNDGDGLIDLLDPGCIDGNDDSEAGPTAPSGLTADAGNTLATCNAIIVSWLDNSTDESRFELERKLTPQADNFYVEIAEPSVAPGSGTVQTFTDTGAVGGLLRDISYTYRIRACNASGCGAYSNADAAINQNPLAQFTWAPPSPFKNANTTFNASASLVYGGSSASEYSWTFVDGIPAIFCSSVAGSGCDNPPLLPLASTRFQFPPSPAQKSVTLRVTDSNVPARQCSITQAVTLRSGSTLPGWIEIAPE